MKLYQSSAAAVLIATGLYLGQPAAAQAQEPPLPPAAGRLDAPPPPPAPGRGLDPRRGPLDRPGPRGERPPLPPGDEQAALPPMDPQAAPVAVKTATDATSGFRPGQVWVRTAPRGEQQLQATILFQNKEVAHLDFDPVNGSVMMRGQRFPSPPPAPDKPGSGAANPATPGTPPIPPAANAPLPPPAPLTDNANGGPSVPVPPAAAPPSTIPPAPNRQVSLDQVKAHLPETIKALRVGQGAEIMDREGFWKIPLIYENRVVGDLHLSSDGTKLIEDFGAARDAAIFAR